MSTEVLIPIAEIKPIEGLNPRGDFAGETLDELAASIEQMGVLQSVLLGERTNGKYPLIAGARRLAAAAKAGLKEIPARVDANLTGKELEAAIAENVQREDLSPVEEARAIRKLRTERGMTQVEVAEALGKSERWVRDREKLLDLPEKAQAGYDAGVVPLDTLGPVEAVAKISPPIAEALVMEAAKGKFEPELLRARHMPTSIEYLIHEKRVPKGACLIPIESGYYSGQEPADLPLDRKQMGELNDLMKAAPKVKRSGYSSPEPMDRITFGDDAAHAAKAYGCLLEVTGNNRYGVESTSRYITDPEFLFDRAKVEIETETKAREKQAAQEKAAEKKSKGEKLKAGTPEAAAEEEAAAERAKERERENRARVKAHAANLELGSKLKQKVGRPKFGMTEARLLAALVLAHDAPGLAARGAYVDEALIEEKRSQSKAQAQAGKDGTLKIEPVHPNVALEALYDELRDAKTPQAILGVIVRHLIAARFADDVVTVQSRRTQTTTPGIGESWNGRNEQIEALIDQVAVAAGVLPDSMRKAAEKRAREA